MSPRQWTCQGCRTVHPRTKQKCACGRKRPGARKPAHAAVLERPYEEWVAEFGEVCGICGRGPSEGRRLDRDHDHRTGLWRGLLCHLCNRALGNRMDLAWAEAAVSYLRRAQAREVAAELRRAA